MNMELEKVLHMSGGTGEISYAETAYIANQVLSMTRATRDEAIKGLISQLQDHEKILSIADLGCSCGPNTFKVVSELLITCEHFIGTSNKRSETLEYDVHLNDLPGNDFNTVFMSLPKLYQELKQKAGLEAGQFFVSATPGTFYGRLFPCHSLHFVHSSYSLYWLSRVPEGIEDKQNIFLSSTSPKSVVQAYKGQFQKDTQLFLRSRSQEMVKGGRMVLTYWGRPTDEEPTSDDTCFVWNLLNNVLNELVSEGIIEEEKVEAFNIPTYHASLIEIVEEVKKEGSFYINATDVSQVNIKGPKQEEQDGGINTNNNSYMNMKGKKVYKASKLFRSVIDSVITSHFGTAVTDQVFGKLSNIIDEEAARGQRFLTNVTISLTKM